MKNAHLRFGRLTYTKVFKKSSTRIQLPLDRFLGEADAKAEMKAHLISVIGGDTQIAAVSAAIAHRDWFTIEAPDGSSFRVSLGGGAECYRGSLTLEGYKRPLRHLVAVSEELAQAAGGKKAERTIVIHDSAQFVWASLAYLHGVPGISEWADWIVDELKRAKAIQPLAGIGCTPVLVTGAKGLFMNCISRGLRQRQLRFPDYNGPILWSGLSLSQLLLPDSG